MYFQIDKRITDTCFHVADWSLSSLFLKNNDDFPWMILVPRVHGISEIFQLDMASRHTLMDEISRLAILMQKQFHPDKLNTGTLGNQVSQLHIHVVARFKNDALWPYGIWQKDAPDHPYPDDKKNDLLKKLKQNAADGC